jgi:histidinol-phosphate aminotransferase
MDLNKRLPENILDLKPYIAGKTIAEVLQEYKPDRISKLASNENRLGCSPHVKEAVLASLDEIQDYPDPIARVLRKKIADVNEVEADEVLVAAGSESLLSILCRVLFKDGEHAITADATFVGFFVQAGVRGIDVVKVPVTDKFEFDTEAVIGSINENTKAIYLANPNNPTGTYLSVADYQRLLNHVPDDVFLIVDEAYFEYARGLDDYPDALRERRENVIILRTFSKAYGLAGFRIGYAIGSRDLIMQLKKAKLTFEPTSPAQAAALAAINDSDFLQKSVQLVEEEKEKLYLFLDSVGVEYIRSASNSVLMVLKNKREAERVTEEMLKKGVILRRVNAFGLPHCIRVTIGTEEEMDHFKDSYKQII